MISCGACRWQQDWGRVAEAYAASVLERIAKSSRCNFLADVAEGFDWQVDGVMWERGRVAVIEISAGSLTDTAAYSGDSNKLQAGLQNTFVRSEREGKKPKHEAVLQLERDIRLLRDGVLQ